MSVSNNTSSMNPCCIPIRYFALALMVIYGIGFMGINDTPGSLQHAIMTSFNLNPYQFSLLFSLASWPSCFGFINGFIIDRFLGVRLACLIYCTLLTLGNIIFLIGSFILNFDMLIAGRILYGLGADPLMLCMNAFILHWFASTNELNMVFAMITSVPWIGSSIVFFMSNRIYQYTKKYYPPDKALGIAVAASTSLTILMALSCLILTLMYRPSNSTITQKSNNSQSDNSKSETKKPTWKSIVKFPILFWIFSLLINLYFLAVMTFLMFSQEFFSKRYKMSLDAASNMSSAFSLVTCVLSSPIGFLVDRVGRNLIFVSISIFFALLAHGIMAFSTSNPFAAVIMLSLSYSMMTASYLPLVSYLVEKHQTSTAYGIAQSGMNGAFAIGSLVAGRIISMYGYDAVEKFYFTVIACTVPFWLVVWIINLLQGNKLNMSAKQKMYFDSDEGSNKHTELQNKTLVAESTGLSTPPALRKVHTISTYDK